jgi:hypothetical protein
MMNPPADYGVQDASRQDHLQTPEHFCQLLLWVQQGI